MERLRFSLVFLFLLMGCAAPAPEVISSDKITTSVYTTMTNSQEAYCSVVFCKKDDPTTVVYLESDSLVACNGVKASLSGNVYIAHFPHVAPEEVRVTVVRPKAGATTVEYFPLQ